MNDYETDTGIYCRRCGVSMYAHGEDCHVEDTEPTTSAPVTHEPLEAVKAAAAELAEQAARVHYALACRTDELSHSGNPVYTASEATLRALVTAAYGAELLERIMEVFYDCNESIAYCAGIARRDLASEAEALADAEAEEAAYQASLAAAGHNEATTTALNEWAAASAAVDRDAQS